MPSCSTNPAIIGGFTICSSIGMPPKPPREMSSGERWVNHGWVQSQRIGGVPRGTKEYLFSSDTSFVASGIELIDPWIPSVKTLGYSRNWIRHGCISANRDFHFPRGKLGFTRNAVQYRPAHAFILFRRRCFQ